jgi:hypothetical protein
MSRINSQTLTTDIKNIINELYFSYKNDNNFTKMVELNYYYSYILYSMEGYINIDNFPLILFEISKLLLYKHTLLLYIMECRTDDAQHIYVLVKLIKNKIIGDITETLEKFHQI